MPTPSCESCDVTQWYVLLHGLVSASNIYSFVWNRCFMIHAILSELEGMELDFNDNLSVLSSSRLYWIVI